MNTFNLTFSDGTELSLNVLDFKPPTLLFDVDETIDVNGNTLKFAKKDSYRFEDFAIKLLDASDDTIEILKKYSIKENNFDGSINDGEYRYELSDCILKSINVDNSDVTLEISLKHMVKKVL